MAKRGIKNFLTKQDKYNIERIKEYHSFNMGRDLRLGELISIALQNEGNYIDDCIQREMNFFTGSDNKSISIN